MMDSWRIELEQLRIVAANYDTWAIDGALRRLCAMLDERETLALATEIMQTYLPLFEENHPDITWVGAWLNAVAKFSNMPGDLLADVEARIREDGTTFASAGAYAFMHANGKLLEAYQVYLYEEKPMRRKSRTIDGCVKALVSVITARVEAYCAVQYPDVWAVRLLGAPAGEHSEHYTMDAFATMREAFLIYQQVTHVYHEHLWSEVADALARRLQAIEQV